MKLSALLAALRRELDDELGPYLWPTAALVGFLNEAVDEGAIRSRQLVESEDAAVSELQLVPGQARYDLHDKVIFIRRAALDAEPGYPLRRVSTAAMDRCGRAWRADQPGFPRYLINDQQGPGRRIVLSPPPAEAGVLRLTVVRYALESEQLSEANLDGEPALDPADHRFLLHWAAYRALNAREVDLEASADAATQLALFERHFGTRPTRAQIQALAIDPLEGTQAVWF